MAIMMIKLLIVAVEITILIALKKINNILLFILEKKEEKKPT